MSEFLERLTSGRTILLIAVAIVLALRLSVPAERDRAADASTLQPTPAALPVTSAALPPR